MTSSIRCVVVDDEPLATQVLEQHIDQIPGVECVATCESALEAVDSIRRQPVDLLFLDIQMPKLSGLDLVRSLDRLPKVIFTTAHREHAVEAFDLDVVDYLLKPVSLSRLLRAIDRFREGAGTTGVDRTDVDPADEVLLDVRANRENVRIRPADIVLVESLGDYVKIHTADGVVVTKETTSAFEERLAPHGFLRVHRSFLVPLKRVSSYTAEEIHVDSHVVPIGRTYRQAVLNRLQG